MFSNTVPTRTAISRGFLLAAALAGCGLISGCGRQAPSFAPGELTVISDPPGSQGELCLGGSTIGRYNMDLQTVVADSFSTDLINGNTGGGVGNLPGAIGGSIGSGQTWNFQGWVRLSGTSRWTDALEVTFEL